MTRAAGVGAVQLAPQMIAALLVLLPCTGALLMQRAPSRDAPRAVHCRAIEAPAPLELTIRSAEWLDSFRGAERAVLIVAEDYATGQRVGSLGLEVLPMTSDGLSPNSAGEEQCCPRPLLSGLVVEPHLRRRGIAHRLMDEAEALVREWGHNELLLHVTASNTAALGFYDALGFECADGTRVAVAEEEPPPKWSLGSWVRSLGSGSETRCLRKSLPP